MTIPHQWQVWTVAAMLCVGLGADPAPATKTPATPAGEKPAASTKLQPLNKQETVLLDAANKRLVLKGRVCLKKGALELLCCLKQTKEHEAILSVDTKAYVVHAGLLALGAEQGKPVEFDPAFKPPTGQQIDIFVNWTDPKGKAHRVAAQELIRYVTYRFYSEKLEKLPPDVKITERLDEMRFDTKNKELLWYGPMTDEAKKRYLAMTQDKAFRKCIESFHARTQPRQMDAHWVFAGSGFYLDEQTKEKYYRAEDGDLICVANFGSATLDIASRSGNGAEELLFEAWTERLPDVDTAVTIELIPVVGKPKTTEPSKTDKPEGVKKAAPK
ncbi:MAG: hypothetical protein JWN70_6034 [Planctomycetaceae bacterium]|nr:hypothetical protein [Planctomycetaceae bacterium]